MAVRTSRALILAAAITALVVTAFAVRFAWRGAGDSRGGALPALGVALEHTSVSGLSAGAYMAGQFQVAHSDIVIGAGLVAGGPYGCAESSFSRLWPIWTTAIPHNTNLALNACTGDSLSVMGKPDIDTLVRRARELAEASDIAPVSGLGDDRVYLFHAREDDTVARSVVEAALAFYRRAGIPGENIKFVRFDQGAHAFLTTDDGLACGETGAPYLNDCDYDQAGAILRHIHPGLEEPDGPPAGAFRVFDQGPYRDSPGKDSMAGEGIIYIPPACRDEPGCRVHVAFHGCQQNRSRVGDDFVRGSGYARWADANRLVILFPQVRRSAVNPRACWDWWGYTGLDFREQSAPQIAAIRAMLARLAQTP